AEAEAQRGRSGEDRLRLPGAPAPRAPDVVKTNAARILHCLGIRYQMRDYEVDEEDLSAESVARKVGSQPSPPSGAHLRSAPTYRRALSRAHLRPAPSGAAERSRSARPGTGRGASE